MKTKYCGLGARTWLATVAVVAAATIVAGLGALAVAASGTSHHASKDKAVSGTAWYAEAAPPSSGNAMAGHANAGQTTANDATKYAKGMSQAFHEAASKVLPSVVMITNTPAMAEKPSDQKSAPDQNSEEMPFGFKGTPFGDLFNNPEFHHFFKQFPSGPMPDMPGQGMDGAGSGVIVDPSGVILTNNHVVAGGGKVMVRLQDGREFKAVDIKTDPKTDLAVLRIEGAGTLPAARLGDSSKVEIGDWVLALGQPFGLEGTVTAGIVSAKERGIGITDREDFIQTDAAINPGNSGGPLVDLDGEVIGINTAISSNNGGYQGVGFAIPANLAKWVGGQLETAGKVQRAYLGVGIQLVTQPLADQFKVKVHKGVHRDRGSVQYPGRQGGIEAGRRDPRFCRQGGFQSAATAGPRGDVQGRQQRAAHGPARWKADDLERQLCRAARRLWRCPHRLPRFRQRRNPLTSRSWESRWRISRRRSPSSWGSRPSMASSSRTCVPAARPTGPA